MTTPYQRRHARQPESSQVATLATKLEGDALVLHHAYEYGYGRLTGPQNAPGAPRPAQARLRLLVERHVMDSLRLGGFGGMDVWLDYDDGADRPLDEIYPAALVIARQGSEPISVPLSWPTRGLKTLKFGAAPPITEAPTTVMLGAQDGGEALMAVVCQIVAAAVLALSDDVDAA